MRRWLLLMLSALTAAAIYACGGAPVPTSTSPGDTCPLLDAGPPEVCPPDCHWDGKECRQGSGIIVEGVRADSGTPR